MVKVIESKLAKRQSLSTVASTKNWSKLFIVNSPAPRSKNLNEPTHQTPEISKRSSSPHYSEVTASITLILLHPVQSVPVQSWKFKDENSISVGRATDNDVILYSAVVSRYHVEIRRREQQWYIENMGVNGTYLNEERISKVPVSDGMVVRLATSGPKIQIRLGDAQTPLSKSNSKVTQPGKGRKSSTAMDTATKTENDDLENDT